MWALTAFSSFTQQHCWSNSPRAVSINQQRVSLYRLGMCSIHFWQWNHPSKCNCSVSALFENSTNRSWYHLHNPHTTGPASRNTCNWPSRKGNNASWSHAPHDGILGKPWHIGWGCRSFAFAVRLWCLCYRDSKEMLQGKRYSRGIRGIKLVHGTLFRMFFISMIAWCDSQERAIQSPVKR